MRWEKWQETYWMPERKKRFDRPSYNRRTQKARLKVRDEVHAKLADWQTKFDISKPKFKQAKHLIEKFGGIIPFSIAVGVHPNSILNNWLDYEMPEFKGSNKLPKAKFYRTNGIVPEQFLVRIMIVARYWGVLLYPEDLYPDHIGAAGVKNYHNNAEIMEWIKKIGTTKDMQNLEHIVASLVSTPD